MKLYTEIPIYTGIDGISKIPSALGNVYYSEKKKNSQYVFK